MPAGVSWGRFAKDLKKEISEDNVSNGAAALAYYLMLAIFPAAIFGLSLIAYLPIPNLNSAIMDLLRQTLPPDSAQMFAGVVQQTVEQRRGGLLSVGFVLTLWAASNGLYAVMQQLNITYDVREGRPFWKARGTALLLTIAFSVLVIGAFALIVFGGVIQQALDSRLGASAPLLVAFAVFRWIVIAAALLLAFAFAYYFGPDVEQRFAFITPGSVVGVVALAAASLVFRFYASRFGNYSATYGSLGAVIILLLWLYLAGWVILFGSEINALVEHYRPGLKRKGEKREPPPGPSAERVGPGGRLPAPARRPSPEPPPGQHP